MITFAAFGLSLLLIEPPNTVPSTTFASTKIVVERDCTTDFALSARDIAPTSAEAALMPTRRVGC